MLCWSDDHGVCRYKGSFEHNCFQGHGVLEWSVKARYVGEFFNGLYHGEGTFEWPDKAHVYRGLWQFGEMSGKGTLTTSCGSIYSGEFQAGNMEGRGTITFITNDQYVGEFKDSLMNGLGSYTWSSGTCLVGAFENNFCNKVGKKTHPNGNTYVGEFLDDQEHGRGVLVDKNGARIVGIWTNGRLVEELVEAIVPPIEVDSIAGPGGEQRVFVATRESDAQTRSLADDAESGSSLVLFANGDKYIGGVERGRKHGNGLYVYADGSAHKGVWNNDALVGAVHPVAAAEESAELTSIHGMNDRNVRGVAALKMAGGNSKQALTLTRLQD